MGWFTRLVAPGLDGRALARDLMDRLDDGSLGVLDFARPCG